MSLEDLEESDIEKLRELLKLSGRAATDRRKALCIAIKFDAGNLSDILTLSENDFAIELIDQLQKKKLEIAVHKLCEELKSDFQGGGYAPELEAIISKLNYNPIRFS